MNTEIRSAFLEGQKVLLCSITREDFGEKMMSWINDKDVTKYLSRGTFPAQQDTLQTEYETTKHNSSEVQLAILDKETKTYIGITGIHSINWLSKHAEFRILIGDKRFWSKGYGTEVCQLLVSYAFEALNMNKVWLGVNTDNTRAAESYSKSGFTHEGILRQELYRNNRYYDVTRMSLLKSEYIGIKRGWSIYEWIKKNYSE